MNRKTLTQRIWAVVLLAAMVAWHVPEYQVSATPPDVTVNDVEATYGDADIDLMTEIQMPDDYSGTITAEADSDVVKINGMTASILHAGNAEITYTFGADGDYDAVTSKGSITIAKRDLGRIESGAVDWDSTSKTYDGKNSMVLSGKFVTEQGDTIKVSANATLNGVSVGNHSSSLSGVTFTGAEDYKITPPTDGPTITVTAKNLNTVYADDIQWDNTEKEYDGINTIQLRGTVKNAEEIIITATGIAADANAGKKETTLTDISVSGADDYTLDVDSKGPQITITKKPLGELTADQFVWSDTSITFNAEAQSTISGQYTGALIGDDKITVQATATRKTIHAGEQASTLSDVRLSGADNYQVTLKADGPAITVSPYPVSLYAEDFSVNFGDATWKQLVDKALVAISHIKTKETLSAKVKAEYDKMKLSDYIDVSIKDDAYLVGDTADALVPAIKSANTGDFTLALASDPTGSVTVRPQITTDEEVWKQISFDDAASSNAAIRNGIVYVRPGGHADFSTIKESLYDTIRLIADNSDQDNRYEAPADAKDGAVSGSVYLYKKTSQATRTDANEQQNGTQNNRIPNGRMVIDGTYPAVSFMGIGELGETDKETFSQTIYFEHYRRDGMTISASTSDEASGVKTAGYRILKIRSQEDAESVITEAIRSQNSWRTLPKDGTIEIPGTDKGYYVVCVRTEDAVGNAAVYTTNGIVIEVTAPEINISGIRDRVYNDDISYNIAVADAGATHTGIDAIQVEVIENGTIVDGTRGANSFDIQHTADPDEKRTFAEIDKLSNTVNIKAKTDGLNSNDIIIRVTATDIAGNEAVESTRVMIDKTLPEISATYDNNDARHGKYFNRDRVMHLTIKERNFDEEQTSVSITKNGKEGRYTIAQLRAGEVKDVSISSDIDDSQSERKQTSLTDERTIRYQIRYSGDDEDYQVAPHSTDTAGNKNDGTNYGNSAAPRSFTIDKIAPVFRVLYENGSGQATEATRIAGNPLFDRASITATLSVRERNFSPAETFAYVTGADASGKAAGGYTVPDIAKASWNSVNALNELKLPTFSTDANYSLSGETTDLAGNHASYATHYFTVDHTPPTGKILTTMESQKAEDERLSSTHAFSIYGKNAGTFTREAADQTSGVASIDYMIYKPGAEARGGIRGYTAEALAGARWAPWTNDIRISPDDQAIVYMRIIDRAGNTTYISTKDGVITEATAPQITIEIKNEKDFYNSDVNFSIVATDPEKNNTYSGLKSVSYRVLKDGKATQEGKYDEELSDKTQRRHSISKNETVSAKDNNSNTVVIRAEATDYSGNTAYAQKEIKIDVTKPVIEVIYDLNNPQNGKYFNKTRTATVRVRERNFDQKDVVFNIKSSGEKPVISDWSIGSGNGKSDSAVHTCKITYAKDADYTFDVAYKDKAGNAADYKRADHFVIDQTKPVVSVTYNNNAHQNGHYYAKHRTAAIRVNEHNFKNDDVKINMSALDPDKKQITMERPAWKDAADTHIAEVPFNKDGDYRYTVEVTDLAGNKADVYEQALFTIDTVKPMLSVEGVVNKTAYNGKVEPMVSFEDKNMKKDAYSVTLEGVQHSKQDVGLQTTEGSVLVQDIPHKVENDDIYTLIASVHDLAGNTSKEELTFSINRFGSNYAFDDATKAALGKFYLNAELPLTVYETNLSSLKEGSISIVKDGVTRELENEKDYKVKDKTDSQGWKVYQYDIGQDNFKDEGLYEILIRSKDEAGNAQNNKIKEAQMQFVIDKTSPSAVMTGIEEGGRYRENTRTINISLNDNAAAEYVSVYVDGEKKATFNESKMSNGSTTFDLESADHWQEVFLAAEDKAGNREKTESIHVLVTRNNWLLFYNNKALFFGTIAAAAGIATLLIVKKRKGAKAA